MTTHMTLVQHGFHPHGTDRDLQRHAEERMHSDPVGALAQLTGTLYARKEGHGQFTFWHRP